jgi:soluble lytic murein transglycosylase
MLFSMIVLGSLAAFACRAADGRYEFRTALLHVERGGKLSPAQQRAFAANPLFVYLEYAGLIRRLDTTRSTEVRDFLQHYDHLAIADTLRLRWLQALARRGAWAEFLADWREREQPPIDLRCHAAYARWQTGAIDAGVQAEVKTLWLHGESMPAACDPLFAALTRAGWLNTELRWQRIALAAENGQIGLLRHLARSLPKADAAQAAAFADFVKSPSGKGVPRTPRGGQFTAIGLARQRGSVYKTSGTLRRRDSTGSPVARGVHPSLRPHRAAHGRLRV